MALARIDARATEKGSLLPTRALTHLWGHDADGVGGKMPVSTLKPEMFGGYPVVEGEDATWAWYDAHTGTKPTYLHFALTDRLFKLLRLSGLAAKGKGLWCFGQQDLDSDRMDMLNPTLPLASVGGGLTAMPGLGVSSDAATGYMQLRAYNELLPQDNACMSIMVAAGADPDTLLAPSSGVAAGLSFLPGSAGGNMGTRFQSASSNLLSRPWRTGQVTLNRLSSAGYSIYDGEDKLADVTAASIATTTSPIRLWGFGSTYTDYTVRMIWFGEGLNEFEIATLNRIMKYYADTLGSVVGKGPTVESIGRESSVTPAERNAAVMQCLSLAQETGAEVRLGYGTYSVFNRLAALSSVSFTGIHRLGSILKMAVGSNPEEPLFAPLHYNGGEEDWSITRMTLDMAATERGITDVGQDMPGPSAVSTNGSKNFNIDKLDIFEAILHSVDAANTGQLHSSGRRLYTLTPNVKNAYCATPSLGGEIKNIRSFFPGDDHITMHFSGGQRTTNIEAFRSSRRHPTAPGSTVGVECDDGCWDQVVDGVSAFGTNLAIAGKGHEGNPVAKRLKFSNITARWVSEGARFHDIDDDPGAERIYLEGYDYAKPWKHDDNAQVIGLHLIGVKGFSGQNITIVGNGYAFQGNAIRISSGVMDAIISDWEADWKNTLINTDFTGETVRVTSGCSGITLRDGRIKGAGLYGIRDTGSVNAHYDNITIGGTGVASSVAFKAGGAVGLTHEYVRTIETFSAGVAGFATAEEITA